MTSDTHSHHPVQIPALDVGPLRSIALGAAVVGLGAFVVLTGVHLSTVHEGGLRDAFFAYLSGWIFWASIPFGALGLMMIAYLNTASWGLVLRRSFQAATRSMWLVAALFLPIIASLFINEGKSAPFWWADKSWQHVSEETKNDPKFKADVEKLVNPPAIENGAKVAGWPTDVAEVAVAKGLRPEAVEEAHHKIHDYLNPGFFTLRYIVYFVVLGGLAWQIGKWAALAEANNDEKAQFNLKAISGPGMIVWGLLLTFAVTDWVMSVEPTWASSMFPVVWGMNAFICTFSVAIFCFYYLNAGKTEVLTIVKDKFRIDIGSLLLGFTMVWAYGSFCQYMLIWAGNLPEEIAYYKKRGDNGWEYLAYILMAFHWLLPFIVLLFREVKTSPKAMQRMTVFLLTVCAADVVWWLVPAVPHPEGGLAAPMAFAAIIGFGGVWGLEFSRQLGRNTILPANKETEFLATWGHH